MMRAIAFAAALTLPCPAVAQLSSDTISAAVNNHILPRYEALATTSAALADAAQRHCEANDPALQAAYHAAFDAWIGISHITFGPAETDGRYFALSFWPDSRSMIGRTLSGLIDAEDPIVEDIDVYAEVSIAARGFYALDFLFYDPQVSVMGDALYRCALLQAITADIASTAAAIRTGWTDSFADRLLTAGSNDRFQSPEEALRVLFGALTTGLEVTADLRLGRPMGSFDAPRPARAEARRSGRSLLHVVLSLAALEELSLILSETDPDLQHRLSAHFAQAHDRAEALEDPVFASVATPQGRLRAEVLQQRVRDIHALVTTELGPRLGVAAGFNSLDGD